LKAAAPNALAGLSHARRIVVVGPPGSGKSTLAIQLGRVLELPVCHLDVLWWRPGWVEAGEAVFDAELAAVVATDDWIVDGNYSRTIPMRLARADAAIMLDFPRTLCLYRVLKRRMMYAGKPRPDMAPGCPEKVDREFILWLWDYPTRSRPRVLQMLGSFGEAHRFVRLDRPNDVRLLLDSLQDQRGSRVGQA
jgi:adenylate kinase family enzyme